jgi:tRNA(His) 5'-end guanylyltransferase
VNTDKMQELLFEQKGINWNNCKTFEKRGTGILRKNTTWVAPIDNKSFKPYQIMNDMIYDSDTMKLFKRSLWSIDTEIPIFTKDRDYILSILPKR